MFKEGKNLNDFINQSEIEFKQIFTNKKLENFDNYSFSKYASNDILFNGNLGALATAYIDFYKNEKNVAMEIIVNPAANVWLWFCIDSFV